MKIYNSLVNGFEGECAADEYFYHGYFLCGWFRKVKPFLWFKIKTGIQFYGSVDEDKIITR